MKQVGGSHYENMELQPITVMGSNFTDEQFEGYLAGNVLKYIMRYRNKNGVEDLKKASTYLNELIFHLEV
jgi:hypothetical protein